MFLCQWLWSQQTVWYQGSFWWHFQRLPCHVHVKVLNFKRSEIPEHFKMQWKKKFFLFNFVEVGVPDKVKKPCCNKQILSDSFMHLKTNTGGRLDQQELHTRHSRCCWAERWPPCCLSPAGYRGFQSSRKELYQMDRVHSCGGRSSPLLVLAAWKYSSYL